MCNYFCNILLLLLVLLQRQILLPGVLTQGTSRFQVGLSLHLDGHRVEVEGGVTSLRHFTEHSLSVR